MRIPGLGGEVLRLAGGTPVNVPGGDLFVSLQKGVIDATEWVGPYNDLAFGLHKAAKYYYSPGWHEPGTTLECFINQKAFDSLPVDLPDLSKILAFIFFLVYVLLWTLFRSRQIIVRRLEQNITSHCAWN